eukprot:gene23818-biopygen20403
MMVSTMVELSDLSLDISAALYSGGMMVSSLAGKSVSDSVSTLVAETAGAQVASLDANSGICSELTKADGMAELKAVSMGRIPDAVGAEPWDDLSAESWG